MVHCETIVDENFILDWLMVALRDRRITCPTTNSALYPTGEVWRKPFTDLVISDSPSMHRRQLQHLACSTKRHLSDNLLSQQYYPLGPDATINCTASGVFVSKSQCVRG